MSSLSAFVRLMLVASLLVAASGIAYNVYPLASPACDPAKAVRPGFELPASAPIGSCHMVSEGENTYSNLEVFSCSARCLCFIQYASEHAEAGCDETLASEYNVKEACLDECKADCDGTECGNSATLDFYSGSRLKLTGSGPICTNVKSELDYLCPTTGMVKFEAKNASKIPTVGSGHSQNTEAFPHTLVGCLTTPTALTWAAVLYTMCAVILHYATSVSFHL